MHIFEILFHYVCTFFLEQFSNSYYVLSKLLIIKYLILFAGNTTSNTDVLSIYKGRKYENAHV